MFSLFNRKSPESERQRAKAAFEKIAGLDSESRAARSTRIRQALLCRAALNKVFVDGAERFAAYQETAARALVAGHEKPPPPVAEQFVTIRVGGEDVLVYLPEEYAQVVFMVGGRYQCAEIDAATAIDRVQAVVDQISRYELKVDDQFPALQFLRDELSSSTPGEVDADAGEGAGQGAGSDPAKPTLAPSRSL
jgi:hypothetical protein